MRKKNTQEDETKSPIDCEVWEAADWQNWDLPDNLGSGTGSAALESPWEVITEIDLKAVATGRQAVKATLSHRSAGGQSREFILHLRTTEAKSSVGGLFVDRPAAASTLSTSSAKLSLHSPFILNLSSPGACSHRGLQGVGVANHLVQYADDLLELWPLSTVLLPAVQHELVEAGRAVHGGWQTVAFIDCLYDLRDIDETFVLSGTVRALL